MDLCHISFYFSFFLLKFCFGISVVLSGRKRSVSALFKWSEKAPSGCAPDLRRDTRNSRNFWILFLYQKNVKNNTQDRSTKYNRLTILSTTKWMIWKYTLRMCARFERRQEISQHSSPTRPSLALFVNISFWVPLLSHMIKSLQNKYQFFPLHCL